jgi:hypothetical protein
MKSFRSEPKAARELAGAVGKIQRHRIPAVRPRI